MMDERIEREVRSWLAAEAAGPVPERLRSRVAVARPPVVVGPFGFRRGWALVVAVVLLAILLVGAGLVALGLLPPSPLACTDVTIDRVEAAIGGSAGYSYRAEGTMLVNDISSPVRTPPADPLDHSERRIAFEGAYAAPADWRITLLDGRDPRSLAPPELQVFINGSSTIGVDGELWATRGASPVYLRPTPGLRRSCVRSSRTSCWPLPAVPTPTSDSAERTSNGRRRMARANSAGCVA